MVKIAYLSDVGCIFHLNYLLILIEPAISKLFMRNNFIIKGKRLFSFVMHLNTQLKNVISLTFCRELCTYPETISNAKTTLHNVRQLCLGVKEK